MTISQHRYPGSGARATSTPGANAQLPSARRALLMMMVPALLLTAMILAWVVSRGGAVSEPELRFALPYFILVNHVIAGGLLLVLLRQEGRTLSAIGWHADGRGAGAASTIIIGLSAGVALYLFKELVLDSVQALVAGNSPTFTSLFRVRFRAAELPLLAVAMTVIAVEESIYRGYGLSALLARWGRASGLLAMGVLFGLLHWGNGPLAILFTGVLGLSFAGLFLWRRSLLVPVIAHASYNALVILT